MPFSFTFPSLPFETVFLLMCVILIGALNAAHYRQAKLGTMRIRRRPLEAFVALRRALARGSETGRPVHISPGAGTIGNRVSTAETIAGLLAAEQVTAEAARNGAPLLVTSGDAVAYLALRGSLRQVYRNVGQAQNYDSQQVQLLAHQDNAAYSTGLATIYRRQPLEASQLIGSFNQEFLLCGEEAAQRGLPQVAGTTSTSALPVMLLTTRETLLGEEVFAAEAYLSDQQTSDARLRTHDILRVVIILLIILGVLYNLVLQPLLGSQLGLPPLPSV